MHRVLILNAIVELSLQVRTRERGGGEAAKVARVVFGRGGVCAGNNTHTHTHKYKPIKEMNYHFIRLLVHSVVILIVFVVTIIAPCVLGK